MARIVGEEVEEEGQKVRGRSENNVVHLGDSQYLQFIPTAEEEKDDFREGTCPDTTPPVGNDKWLINQMIKTFDKILENNFIVLLAEEGP